MIPLQQSIFDALANGDDLLDVINELVPNDEENELAFEILEKVTELIVKLANN